MNQENNQVSIENKLAEGYSFLQDAAFLELNNSIGVSEDQNRTLKSDNAFLCRAANLVFGTRDIKQIQINAEHNVAIKTFSKLDQRRASQILKTKQGLKKTLTALFALKKEHAELKQYVEKAIQNIECEIDSINKKIEIRDRVKTILNYWELSDIPMSPFSQMILLLAELKWTGFESETRKDEDFKNWLKSELIKACCKKFGCKMQQPVPLHSVITALKLEKIEIQDALNLALPHFNNEIANQTHGILLNQLNHVNLQPIMSMKRLSEQLLNGVIE